MRSNGNFGGKVFAVPLAKRSHAYLTCVRAPRVRVRVRARSRMALLAAAMLEAGTFADSGPSGSGNTDSTR